MQSEYNKRIAKNTLMLYFRMGITMLVSLYTSRVVLASLGIKDFGIYNVVGGIVTLFGFLNATLASGTQRFLTYALGTENLKDSQKTFTIGIFIHTALALIILVLAETIGLWFLNNKMNITTDRMYAARLVYQFSVIASLIEIMQVPYNSSIIAHEKMNVYAYVSIIEVTLKLLMVYFLTISSFDKLILYSALILAIQVIIILIYRIYCLRNFIECHVKLIWDKQLFHSMIAFSGWNVFGCLSGILSNQGINILLNIFFGPIINAARGVAYQVNSAVSNFVNNFQTAVNPQIIKLYAANERDKMHKLMINNSKYALFLMAFLIVPLFLEIDFLLKVWLKEVPQHTALFCRLILIQSLFQCIDKPIVMGVHASGKMKIPNLTAGTVYLLVLPISYLVLKRGAAPYIPFIISILSYPIAMTIDVYLIKNFIGFPIMKFINEVLIRGFIVIFFALIFPIYFHLAISNYIIRLLVVVISSIITMSLSIYYIGIDKPLRRKIIALINAKILFLKNKNVYSQNQTF